MKKLNKQTVTMATTLLFSMGILLSGNTFAKDDQLKDFVTQIELETAINDIQLKEGPQGPTGATGADGAQGPIGATGADGVQGLIGLSGVDGAQGPVGTTGADGVQGLIGLSGVDGAQGPVGTTGADGVQGPIGATGADGVQGLIGLSGVDGAQGPVGTTGADGVQGPVGLSGVDGAQGPIGATGAVGAQGLIGLSGVDGAQGPIGATGADGVQGPVGATGADGERGPIGQTGFNGVDGVDGTSVPDGALDGDTLVWNATDGTWDPTAASSTLAIGDLYQGGKVFWLDASGQHGLIAALADQTPADTGIHWYNGTYRDTGATGNGLYAGAMNTTLLIAMQMNDSVSGGFAAKLTADYSVQENGVTACPIVPIGISATTDVICYGDWYLPSRVELNMLYQNKDIAGVGGFAYDYYWSSTESGSNAAWGQGFGGGSQYGFNKGYTNFRVRAVRAF